MAFFEQLSKKVTQVSQTTIQKTKEIADIAKLNSNISEEERTIESLYNQIGKYYVEKYGNNCDEECKSLVNNIKEAEEKIQDYRMQIQEIKGVIRCPNCQTDIPEHSQFCNVCGYKLETNLVEETNCDEIKISEVTCDNKCAACGAVLESEALFCPECGTKVEENQKDL